MRFLIIPLWLCLAACSPQTAVMVTKCMDGTKYARVVAMDGSGSYFIKIRHAREGEIRNIMEKRLKKE